MIGAGYTGLSAAYHLARDYGVKVRVLDAAIPGWGGSGRNGGFVGGGGSKLDALVLARRYGLAETRRFLDWQRGSTARVAEILQAENIDADKAGEQEVGVAHRANRVDGIRDYVAYRTRCLTPVTRSWIGISVPNEALRALKCMVAIQSPGILVFAR